MSIVISSISIVKSSISIRHPELSPEGESDKEEAQVLDSSLYDARINRSIDWMGRP